MFSWLCVLLTVVVLVSWLHSPNRKPLLDLQVRAACLALLLCAVVWLLMHFVCASMEARWTDTLLQGRLPVNPNATDPLQTALLASAPKTAPKTAVKTAVKTVPAGALANVSRQFWTPTAQPSD